MEMKFVLDGGNSGAPADAALVRLLVRAYSLGHYLASHLRVSILEEVGAKQGMGAPYAARLMRLNFSPPTSSSRS